MAQIIHERIELGGGDVRVGGEIFGIVSRRRASVMLYER